MTRALQILAVGLAIGGGVYLIYRAQEAAEPAGAPASAESASAGSKAKTTPASATSKAAASAASQAAKSAGTVASAASAASAAPASIEVDNDLKFMGTSKSFGDPDLFLKGTKAPMGGLDFPKKEGFGRLKGTEIGTQRGTPAVDVRGKAPASKPVRVEPPRKFMGGTKFDPGSIPNAPPK